MTYMYTVFRPHCFSLFVFYLFIFRIIELFPLLFASWGILKVEVLGLSYLNFGSIIYFCEAEHPLSLSAEAPEFTIIGSTIYLYGQYKLKTKVTGRFAIISSTIYLYGQYKLKTKVTDRFAITGSTIYLYGQYKLKTKVTGRFGVVLFFNLIWSIHGVSKDLL